MFDQHLGFTHDIEERTVQKPVSQLAIKALTVAIFLSATGLEKAKEAAFRHRERDSIGVAVSARDRQANKDGKKLIVEQHPPPRPQEPQRQRDGKGFPVTHPPTDCRGGYHTISLSVKQDSPVFRVRRNKLISRHYLGYFDVCYCGEQERSDRPLHNRSANDHFHSMCRKFISPKKLRYSS